jgi:hypothetical protein
VSVGYFIADLAMIMWLYPSLGGMEYVSLLFLLSLFLSLLSLSSFGLFMCFLLCQFNEINCQEHSLLSSFYFFFGKKHELVSPWLIIGFLTQILNKNLF